MPEFDATGKIRGGCPPGQMQPGPLLDCIPIPQYTGDWAAQRQANIAKIATVYTCYPPDQITALGPCAQGYTRDMCSGVCSPDPFWRAPAGTEGDYINVDGTLVRRSAIGLPPAASSAGSDDFLGSLGISPTMLLLLAVAGFFLLKGR